MSKSLLHALGLLLALAASSSYAGAFELKSYKLGNTAPKTCKIEKIDDSSGRCFLSNDTYAGLPVDFVFRVKSPSNEITSITVLFRQKGGVNFGPEIVAALINKFGVPSLMNRENNEHTWVKQKETLHWDGRRPSLSLLSIDEIRSSDTKKTKKAASDM